MAKGKRGRPKKDPVLRDKGKREVRYQAISKSPCSHG